MKSKITGFAVFSVCALACYTYFFHLTAVEPRDLRDAVSDSALGALEGGAGSDVQPNTPEPEKIKPAAALDPAVESLLAPLPGDMPYAKAYSLFMKGVPAVKEDLAGWHAGRAFHENGAVDGALLAGRMNGPKKFVVTYHESAISPEYFDTVTPAEIKRLSLDLKRYPELSWKVKFPEATADRPAGADMIPAGGKVIDSDTGKVKYIEGSHLESKVKVTSELRKADGRIVVRLVTYDDADVRSETEYLVYFRDVTPGR